MSDKIVCPNCGSERIGYFRLDSDCGNGGDWSSANLDESYTKEDLQSFINNERPDIECNVCIQCCTAFLRITP